MAPSESGSPVLETSAHIYGREPDATTKALFRLAITACIPNGGNFLIRFPLPSESSTPIDKAINHRTTIKLSKFEEDTIGAEDKAILDTFLEITWVKFRSGPHEMRAKEVLRKTGLGDIVLTDEGGDMHAQLSFKERLPLLQAWVESEWAAWIKYVEHSRQQDLSNDVDKSSNTIWSGER